MNKGMLLLMILALMVSEGVFAQDRQVLYRAPDGLQLTFKPLTGEGTGGRIVMKAEIKALVGSPSGIGVRFLSSPDIQVETKGPSFDTIPAGQAKDFEVVLVPGKGKPDRRYSWVKMEVSFKPDFKSLLETIASGTTAFPVEAQRRRLIDAVTQAQKKGETASQLVGFPFLSGAKFGQ